MFPVTVVDVTVRVPPFQIPPPSLAVLPLIVLLRIVTVAAVLFTVTPPPSVSAVLPVIVLAMMSAVLFANTPPECNEVAWLLMTVLSSSVSPPELWMPPEPPAVFPLTSTLVRVAVPSLVSPPPAPVGARLPLMVLSMISMVPLE